MIPKNFILFLKTLYYTFKLYSKILYTEEYAISNLNIGGGVLAHGKKTMMVDEL